MTNWTDWAGYPVPFEDYNITNFTAWFGYVSKVTAPNQVGVGFFGPSIVLLTFIIAFSSTKMRYNMGTSISVGGFFGFVISVFLRIGGVLSDDVVIIMLLLTVVGVLSLIFYQKSD